MIFNEFYIHHCVLLGNQTPQLSGKRATVERSGMKFGHRGCVLSVYIVLLTVKWLRSFWGHSVHFRFSASLYLEKGWAYSKREWNLGLGDEYSVYTLCFWQLSAWGFSGAMWCISDFRQTCVSKTAGRTTKGSEIWASGWVFSVHRVLFTVKCLRSFWCHSVYFWFSARLYLENG